ncbi:MAG: NUDIX domain-containing protein [Oculatellaceae cyanobacterium Prado106]|jgi:hypothetical protein|nr:NUDIX domain-containing protein [Oculatellaceae cyanobacterium Prado106]
MGTGRAKVTRLHLQAVGLSNYTIKQLVKELDAVSTHDRLKEYLASDLKAAIEKRLANPKVQAENQAQLQRVLTWLNGESNVKTTVRVGAYILRQNHQGLHQLLMFNHPDCPEAPIQIPGGGVEPQESLEAALYREVFEECGLREVAIARKLGIAEICWTQPDKLISQRHCFLMTTTQSTPETWDHIVQGDGIDSGMIFSYFWQRPAIDFKLPADLGQFLYPKHIPELYGA